MESSLEKKVIEIICSFLGIEKKEISKDSHFFEDLNIDSKIALTDLCLKISEELKVKIPPENIKNLKKVSDLINLVEENSNEFL